MGVCVQLAFAFAFALVIVSVHYPYVPCSFVQGGGLYQAQIGKLVTVAETSYTTGHCPHIFNTVNAGMSAILTHLLITILDRIVWFGMAGFLL